MDKKGNFLVTGVMAIGLTFVLGGCEKKEYCGGDAVFVSGGDVYVAGSISQGSSATDVPTLWKNGVPQSIGQQGNFNSAKSVFVAGSDVYVAIGENEQNRALLWKNGVTQQLSSADNVYNSANSVFVSGNDVYVAGVDKEQPVLWKNGIPQYLAYQGSATAVVVSGNDVYVVGYEGVSFTGRAVIWKNGIANYLSENISEANAIFISDGDVYVAGEDNKLAALWKNNVLQQLDNVGKSTAYSVAVANGSVYVTGVGFDEEYKSIAMLWKNGNSQRIEAEIGYQAMSVVVSDNNVYIAGRNIGTCPLWKFNIE